MSRRSKGSYQMVTQPFGSAVIVGCARSCAPYLDGVLRNLEAFASTYERSAVVFFENNSTDDTNARLSAYVSAKPDAILLTQTGLGSEISEKSKRLAMARNACLSAIRASPYREFDQLVIFDFDGVNANPIDVGPFVEARKFLIPAEI